MGKRCVISPKSTYLGGMSFWGVDGGGARATGMSFSGGLAEGLREPCKESALALPVLWEWEVAIIFVRGMMSDQPRDECLEAPKSKSSTDREQETQEGW